MSAKQWPEVRKITLDDLNDVIVAGITSESHQIDFDAGGPYELVGEIDPAKRMAAGGWVGATASNPGAGVFRHDVRAADGTVTEMALKVYPPGEHYAGKLSADVAGARSDQPVVRVLLEHVCRPS